jgi:hypothetical protein
MITTVQSAILQTNNQHKGFMIINLFRIIPEEKTGSKFGIYPPLAVQK